PRPVRRRPFNFGHPSPSPADTLRPGEGLDQSQPTTPDARNPTRRPLGVGRLHIRPGAGLPTGPCQGIALEPAAGAAIRGGTSEPATPDHPDPRAPAPA